jgi:ABC-type uncharacterized transport system YnjBCD ATPase subunit
VTQTAPVPRGQAAPPAPVLELAGVVMEYPGDPAVTALAGVSLRVGQGELVAIVGPSASGKSTLLHVMGTLERPTSGVVRIAGEDTSAMSDTQLSGVRARRLGFVFQQFFLLDGMSVLDNVANGLLYRGGRAAERRRLAETAIERAETGGSSVIHRSAYDTGASRLSRRDLLRVGSLGLRSRRVRAALSALGISIGIAAIVGVLGISQSSKTGLLNELGELGNLISVQPQSTAFGQQTELPTTAEGMVSRIGPVTSVSEIGNIANVYVYRNSLVPASDTSGISLTATDAALPATVDATVAHGTFLNAATARFRRSSSAPRRPACSASTTWPTRPRYGSAGTRSSSWAS